jgi:hypothetical protein
MQTAEGVESVPCPQRLDNEKDAGKMMLQRMQAKQLNPFRCSMVKGLCLRVSSLEAEVESLRDFKLLAQSAVGMKNSKNNCVTN